MKPQSTELSERVGKVLLAAVSTMVFGTVGFFVLDRLHNGEATAFDCAYQTFIIVSTLGIDKVSGLLDHNWGRMFSMVVWFLGAIVFAFAFTALTAFVIEGELSNILGRRRMDREIAKLQNHYIVCGSGRTGVYIINELITTKRRFVVIDTDEERLKEVAGSREALYLVGDAHEEDILREAGIERAAGLLATLASDRDNLFLVITARQLNPNLRIIARGFELTARDKLVRAGADNVVYPNFIGGMRMVSEMVRPAAVGFLDQMLRQGDLRVEQVVVHEGSELIGKSLRDSQIRQKTGLLVVACRDQGNAAMNYNPGVDTMIQSGMALVVLGQMEQLPPLRALAGEA